MDDNIYSWLGLMASNQTWKRRQEIMAAGGPVAVLRAGKLGDDVLTGHLSADEAKAMITPFLKSGGRLIGGSDVSAFAKIESRNRAPLVFFARGDMPIEDERKRIAVIGARDATDIGLMRARRVTTLLAGAGVVIVAGGARGIDRMVHETAIEVGGATIAVLGEPVRKNGDDERPGWMRHIFDEVPHRALTISGFGPWLGYNPQHFAWRNRMIAGICDGVVVIEGAARSGTLHTVKDAITLKLPIWTFTHSPEIAQSAVPRMLLKEGLAVELEPGNICPIVGGEPPPEAAPGAEDDPDAPPLVRAVRKAGGRLLIDDAARRLQMAVPALLSQVASLELEGQLRREGAVLVVKS